jgi:hypothetical protein
MVKKSKFLFTYIHTFLKLSIIIFRILVHLINWKKPQGFKNRSKDENLRLCKLEFYLCVRDSPGKYRFVSPASYSSIIEEGIICFHLIYIYRVAIN